MKKEACGAGECRLNCRCGCRRDPGACDFVTGGRIQVLRLVMELIAMAQIVPCDPGAGFGGRRGYEPKAMLAVIAPKTLVHETCRGMSGYLRDRPLFLRRRCGILQPTRRSGLDRVTCAVWARGALAPFGDEMGRTPPRMRRAADARIRRCSRTVPVSPGALHHGVSHGVGGWSTYTAQRNTRHIEGRRYGRGPPEKERTPQAGQIRARPFQFHVACGLCATW